MIKTRCDLKAYLEADLARFVDGKPTLKIGYWAMMNGIFIIIFIILGCWNFI